jgi:hypothetical protein
MNEVGVNQFILANFHQKKVTGGQYVDKKITGMIIDSESFEFIFEDGSTWGPALFNSYNITANSKEEKGKKKVNYRQRVIEKVENPRKGRVMKRFGFFIETNNHQGEKVPEIIIALSFLNQTVGWSKAPNVDIVIDKITTDENGIRFDGNASQNGNNPTKVSLESEWGSIGINSICEHANMFAKKWDRI